MVSHPPAITTLVYKTTHQGLSLSLDVFAPAGAGTNPSPVILWLHAGGLIFCERRDLGFPQWLADECRQKGWTLVTPDYRLLPEATIDELLSDVQDAWKFVHTKLNAHLHALGWPAVDLASAFAVGASAGGYLALQGGHLFTPRPKAVASLYGYGCCDAKFFGTSKPPETLLGGLPLSNVLEHSRELEALLDVKGRPQIAGFPFNPGWGLREMLYLYLVGTGRYISEVFKQPAVSSDPKVAYLWPQTSITPAFPPTFLTHGTNDSFVPCTESETIAALLKDNGVEHELLLVPGAEHIFDVMVDDDEGPVEDARQRVVAFLQNHL